MDMRTAQSRVRGLGSAKEGVAHWWAERLTAIALVPLVLWFAVAAIPMVGADHAAFKAWVGEFGNALLLVLLTIALFHHAQLGLQVVVEDYVHGEAAKVTCLVTIKFWAILCGVATIMAILRVGFAA